GDPAQSARRRGHREHGALHRLHLERSQPDLVSRLLYGSTKLGADLAPRCCRLEMLRQLQATPFRERLWGTIREGARTPGRRIYQRPLSRNGGARVALTQSAGKTATPQSWGKRQAAAYTAGLS